jgi:5'-nucleotidase / UDP-sugar diphosphatase
MPAKGKSLLNGSMNLDRRRFIQVAGASMVVAGAGTFTMTSAFSQANGFRLNILHINDMHSRIQEISGSDATCSPDASTSGECFGGAARLATAIRDRRSALEAENAPVLTLDAGDQSQGTLFYTTYRGRAEIEMMNMIGFDAMTLGNHEFNHGPDELAVMLAEADFPIVAGNVIAPDDHALADLIHDHHIIEIGDQRVGILGITTPDTAFLSSPGPVTFQDEIEHLNEAVERLRAEGVNNIVLLSHVGFVRDQEIAAQVDGLSVIVGGHSHTLLSNSDDSTPDYATMVESPSGRAVPIVQAYAFSRYLGDLELHFDEDGAVTSATGDTILLDASFEPAEDVEARIAELSGPIEELIRTPVAEVAAPIDGSRESCRAMECEMGNTVTDAMLAEVSNQDDITIAFTNGGGLRASIEAGTATLGDVLTVLPFQNTLYTLRLPGSAIVDALEFGVNGVEEGAGRFPQVSGLRFDLDLSVAPNEGRVSNVEVRDGENWVPIDPDATYGVVTNNFTAAGGDGYEMIANEATEGYDTAIDLAEVLARYLTDNEPFAPSIDGRINQ